MHDKEKSDEMKERKDQMKLESEKIAW